MRYRAALAAGALLSAGLLLLRRGWSPGPGQLFVASARLPAARVRSFAPPVMSGAAESGAEKSGGDDKAKKKKTVFKAPAFLRQCEYSWDCDSPLQCCEFAGASFCCRGGVGVPAFAPQPQAIPIPVPVPRGPPGYPQGLTGGYPS